MRVLIDRKSATLSAGAYSFNTIALFGHCLKWVYVAPATSSNVYDITITNTDGDQIYKRTSVTGTMNDVDIGTPLVGVYTVSVSSATVVGDTIVINFGAIIHGA